MDHYKFDSSTDDSVYTTKFLSVKVNLSVAKMEPQLAEVVFSVCRVLAQECANQIICNRKKKRKIWVRDWVARRNILGVSNTLLTELQVEGRPGFMNYMTMSKGHFNILLKKIGNAYSITEHIFSRNNTSYYKARNHIKISRYWRVVFITTVLFSSTQKYH